MSSKRGISVGERFGKLTVEKELEPLFYAPRTKVRRFLCKCDCGDKIEVRYCHLINGRTKSCGCIRKEMCASRRVLPKSLTESRIYRIWNGIKSRCYTTGHEGYDKYGAKGITMCDEWRSDFMAFYNWATGNGYSDELQIDRIDFNGNYEPSNCRWVTLVEQANNKSNVVKYTFNEEEHTISEWSSLTGISSSTIWQRLKKLNWSIEKTLTTPIRKPNAK